MLTVLNDAIEGGRVDLYLQPIVTLPERKLRYYEGLTRLQDRFRRDRHAARLSAGRRARAADADRRQRALGEERAAAQATSLRFTRQGRVLQHRDPVPARPGLLPRARRVHGGEQRAIGEPHLRGEPAGDPRRSPAASSPASTRWARSASASPSTMSAISTSISPAYAIAPSASSRSTPRPSCTI